MELLIVIAGVILLWKFSSSLNAVASSAKVKAEVMAEDVIAQSVVERTDNFERYQKAIEGKEIRSHEEIMNMFKVN